MTRRAVLLLASGVGGLAWLHGSGAFSSAEVDRASTVSVASDDDALLSVTGLNDGQEFPVTPNPHEVEFTNKASKELTASLSGTSTTFSPEGFTFDAGESQTVDIDTVEPVCTLDSAVTIDVDATGDTFSVELERAINLVAAKNVVGISDSEVTFDSETVSNVLSVKRNSNSDADVDFNADGTTFEECLFIDIDAGTGGVDVDLGLDNGTRIKGDVKITLLSEDEVQIDFGNVAGSTTIEGDLTVEAFAPDLDNVPNDEADLENQIDGDVQGDITLVREGDPPTDGDPPDSGVETVDDSAPLDESESVEFAVQIAESESRTVDGFTIRTPSENNSAVEDEFTEINNQGQPEVELTVDEDTRGEANRRGNDVYENGEQHDLDDNATFEDGEILAVNMGDIEGGGVGFTYDVVDSSANADIEVELFFEDGGSHSSFLQVSNVNT